MLKQIENYITLFVDFVWGMPLLILLVGGGSIFLIYSQFIPFRYFRHAIAILMGKYDDKNDPGEINHYQALAAALAATIGVGNISGVAVAITTGGPGAVFWMWVSAVVGMATKYFTCTLSVMYRGKDSLGDLQGGPMYVIEEGMGRQWKPLAVFFCLAGMIGCFPIFQANQLTEVVRSVVLVPNHWVGENTFYTDLATGIGIVIIVSLVIFGGIKRIGVIAGSMMPLMVISYVLSCFYILFYNIQNIPSGFYTIFTDAFSGNALLGGAVGTLIIIGVKRAAFSNEAGIGTSPMMHGAVKTKEPVREGLVAMMEPFIDTIVVCTMTALIIIMSGVWQHKIDPQKPVAIQVENSQEGGKVVFKIKATKPDPKVQTEQPQLAQKGQEDYHLKADIRGDSIVLISESGALPTQLELKADNQIKNIPLIIKQQEISGQNYIILKEDRSRGVTVTAEVFNQAMPGFGQYILLFCISIFALTTLFSYSYYGMKCFAYLFGAKYKSLYNIFYVASIIFGAVASVKAAVGIIDGMYALMAVPTMGSTLYLAPRVMRASRDYFSRLKASKAQAKAKV
ncbi:MAG: alanine/glycine:cation symporter family protein [Microscillaceae bacterium]|nr:alanine/glycine:cation symporter family protein [Microscillaceae bacterium]